VPIDKNQRLQGSNSALLQNWPTCASSTQQHHLVLRAEPAMLVHKLPMKTGLKPLTPTNPAQTRPSFLLACK
jgi:hypothetical protein